MNDLRNRAWRRSKSKIKSRINSCDNEKQWIPEKSWKLMYTRAEKLRRAKLLRTEYPKRTLRQVLDNEQPLSE